MKYNDEKRQIILEDLIWDYDINIAEMIELIDGKCDQAGPFDREQLFIRSLERLPWNRISGLWGSETADKMLSKDTICRVWNKSRREQLERLEKILRGEPVSLPGWSTELREKIAGTVFSNRWYSSEQRVL